MNVRDIRDMRSDKVRNAAQAARTPGAIEVIDDQHYIVQGVRGPSRRIHVYRGLDGDWKCEKDENRIPGNPCGHVLAVLFFRRDLDPHPNRAPINHKGDESRNHTIEERAWTALPTELPRLLSELLRTCIPTEPPQRSRGRPRKSLYSKFYQGIMRSYEQANLRTSTGSMRTLENQLHNPDGGVGRNCLSRFMQDPQVLELAYQILAVTNGAARPYEKLVHLDGTGFSIEQFGFYYNEKYRVPEERRVHKHDMVVYAWTYNYGLVAAMHHSPGPVGEAAWAIPLVQRVRAIYDLKEVGGDKAYATLALTEYLRIQEIQSHIKIKKTNTPGAGYAVAGRKGMRELINRWHTDPEGTQRAYARRNNAEAMNHSIKWFLGQTLRGLTPNARAVEAAFGAIAFNLNRLLVLKFTENTDLNFQAGKALVDQSHWVPLPTMRKQYQRSATPRFKAPPMTPFTYHVSKGTQESPPAIEAEVETA